MMLASTDRKNDPGIVAGAAVLGLFIPAVLWFFARRRHRWPKWVLLVLLVVGIPGPITFLDARSLLALGDAVALVVLLKGWSETERAEGVEGAEVMGGAGSEDGPVEPARRGPAAKPPA